ncbi:unnamed protein product [Blepharisma stoltei]|uniref:Reverse transcriptase zinc-binding domain-containing protein n=1 Tax=Blepharisma stoltei TaxID=1481888 RepID=A0AAU9JVA8_9CILI|nr:unnamed protein product [Blepharisma stoltei]
MRTAMCATRGRVQALKGIQIRKKLTILRACVNTVGLYGLEATGMKEGSEKLMNQLEVMQRRWIRMVLSAPQGVANETLYMETGILSIEMQLAIKILRYGVKLEREAKIKEQCWVKHTYLISVWTWLGANHELDEAEAIQLVQNRIGSPKEAKKVIKEEMRKFAWNHYAGRIEKEVQKTTRLFVKLNDGKDKIERSPYIYMNSHRGFEIAQIFRLRAGFNETASSRNIRHLDHDRKCRICGWIEEDEIHLMDDCYLYESYRVEFFMKLDNIGVIEGIIEERLKVHEIALYSNRFVELMNKKYKEKFEDVDMEIKRFIYSIMRKREKCCSCSDR